MHKLTIYSKIKIGSPFYRCQDVWQVELAEQDTRRTATAGYQHVGAWYDRQSRAVDLFEFTTTINDGRAYEVSIRGFYEDGKLFPLSAIVGFDLHWSTATRQQFWIAPKLLPSYFNKAIYQHPYMGIRDKAHQLDVAYVGTLTDKTYCTFARWHTRMLVQDLHTKTVPAEEKRMLLLIATAFDSLREFNHDDARLLRDVNLSGSLRNEFLSAISLPLWFKSKADLLRREKQIAQYSKERSKKWKSINFTL